MQWISISNKFRFYVFFFLVLPILTLSFFLLTGEINRAYELSEREQLTYLRSIVENNIKSQINNMEHVLELYDDDPRLKNGNLQDYINVSREWGVFVNSVGMDINIRFLDKDNILLTNGKLPVENRNQLKWQRNNSPDNNVIWNEPHRKPEDKLLIISGTKSVINSDGEKCGILAIEIKINDLFYSIKYSELGLPANLVLLMETGRIINLNREPGEPVTYGFLDMSKIKDGESSKHSIGKKEYYVSTMYISKLRVHLAAIVPVDEVRPYFSDTLVIAIIIIIFSIVFLILGGILVTNTVIKNIYRITDYMHDISEGHMEIQNCINSNDEFQIMNESLNSMVEDLSLSITRRDELLSLRTNLINIFSHNASTPITILFNNGMMLMQKYPDEPVLEDMFYASNELKGLIDHLMIYLRMEKNRLNLTKENVYIDEVTAITLKMYKVSMDKKRITVTQDIEEDLNIEGSYFFVKTVIENLIDNAVKFTPVNGTISIKSEYKDETLEWLISDSGPGFTAEDRKKIFGEFQKLSAKPTANESSTGLGLYIVKRLMNSLNGDIILEESEGTGATFRLIFPLQIV